MIQPKSIDEKMIEKCVRHARATVRQAKTKGLVPYDLGIAMLQEALGLIYEIDIERVSYLVPHLNAYATEILYSQIIEKAKVDGCSDRELDFLKKRAVDLACELGTAVIRELVPIAEARAQLMGGTALPPKAWASGVKPPKDGPN